VNSIPLNFGAYGMWHSRKSTPRSMFTKHFKLILSDTIFLHILLWKLFRIRSLFMHLHYWESYFSLRKTLVDSASKGNWLLNYSFHLVLKPDVPYWIFLDSLRGYFSNPILLTSGTFAMLAQVAVTHCRTRIRYEHLPNIQRLVLVSVSAPLS
jgi:hypothetical protein